ncbi:hypothetical protein M8C21_028242 [Ambrosia artemisiifolia]|uniref:Uncharacterized protein n=1 Tax=Ambrosia artemisiifolia TaxID=4212 RepID=A0AAD5GN84_AMBAR|nr:hypothetical protein M8C21_028242 [Ambrosia artemisiifolia]
MRLHHCSLTLLTPYGLPSSILGFFMFYQPFLKMELGFLWGEETTDRGLGMSHSGIDPKELEKCNCEKSLVEKEMQVLKSKSGQIATKLKAKERTYERSSIAQGLSMDQQNARLKHKFFHYIKAIKLCSEHRNPGGAGMAGCPTFLGSNNDNKLLRGRGKTTPDGNPSWCRQGMASFATSQEG